MRHQGLCKDPIKRSIAIAYLEVIVSNACLSNNAPIVLQINSTYIGNGKSTELPPHRVEHENKKAHINSWYLDAGQDMQNGQGLGAKLCVFNTVTRTLHVTEQYLCMYLHFHGPNPCSGRYLVILSNESRGLRITQRRSSLRIRHAQAFDQLVLLAECSEVIMYWMRTSSKMLDYFPIAAD